MRRLLEKFYSFNPAKRLITIVTMLVLFATLLTAYSFNNLYRALKPYVNDNNAFETPQYKGFHKLLETTNYQFVDEETKAAVSSWKDLTEYSGKFMRRAGNVGSDYQITGLDDEHERIVATTIKTFNGLDWQMMSLFASPQVDPFGNDMPEKFSTIRDVSRFLGAYCSYFKEKYPEEDCSFIIGAMLKVARINDLTSPFLIGKMITIALDKIVLRSLRELITQDKLLPSEAKICYAELKIAIALDKPIQRALNDEYAFFKHAYARLYTNAPFALWVLEKIYGDPAGEYQNLTRRLLEAADAESVFKSIRHPLLLIAFPNFRLAWDKYERSLAERSILLTDLSQISGELSVNIDPYNGEALKSIARDGKTVFYSVGPDKIDAQCSGDDVFLE